MTGKNLHIVETMIESMNSYSRRHAGKRPAYVFMANEVSNRYVLECRHASHPDVTDSFFFGARVLVCNEMNVVRDGSFLFSDQTQ